MSSSDSERLISTITRSPSISELIELTKYTFRDCEFKEVENILTCRERDMKMEMGNLIRDHDSMKKEVLLLEVTQSLTVLEKLKAEEKLQKSERKCEVLKETVKRLTEELRVSRDRVEKAEEMYDEICKENLKMTSEINKLKLELNEKTSEFDLEAEYMEKDENMVRVDEEMENLRREKAVSDQAVEDLRCKLLEANRVAEDLKRLQNLEATQNVDDDDKLKETDDEIERENEVDKLLLQILQIQKTSHFVASLQRTR